jgi:hypothetical protein
MKKIRLSIIFLLFSFLFANLRLIAGSGTSSAQFLQLSPSPRASALGNAYTAFAEDADSVYYNPAVSAVMRDMKFSASYALWLESMNYFSFFTVYPLVHSVSMSVGLLGLTSGLIPETMDPGNGNISLTGRNFTSGDYCVMAGLSFGLFDFLDAGISLKYVNQLLDDKTSSAFAGDVGLFYRGNLYGIKAGLVVQNIGTSPKFVTDSFPLPIVVKFGLNYNLILAPSNNFLRNIILTAEVRDAIQDGFSAGAGMEANLFGVFSLRAGYDFVPGNDSQGFKFGAGFRYNRIIVEMNRFTVQANYSIGLYRNFGPTHLFEINVATHFFGDWVPHQQKGLLQKADTYMTNVSTYSEALPDYSEVARSVPSHLRSAYNIACIYSVKQDVVNAVAWLEKVLKKDHSPQMILRIDDDPDLDTVRMTPEFMALLKKYRR